MLLRILRKQFVYSPDRILEMKIFILLYSNYPSGRLKKLDSIVVRCIFSTYFNLIYVEMYKENKRFYNENV